MKNYLTHLFIYPASLIPILLVSGVMIFIMYYIPCTITYILCSIPIILINLQVYGEYKGKEGVKSIIKNIFKRK